MQIETSIINALKLIGMPENITPVLSDRSGVEPRAPYLLLNVISTSNIGLPRKTINHILDNKVESLFQVKEFLISFTFHAETKGDTLVNEDLPSGINTNL
jgi:hypothetical protein